MVNPPWANFVIDSIVTFYLRLKYLGRCGRIKPEKQDNFIPDNNCHLHPFGMVAENSKENINDASFRVAQWRAVGITEIGRLKHSSIKHASRWNVARHNVHIIPALSNLTNRVYLPPHKTIVSVPTFQRQINAVGLNRHQRRW
jgi:hypothetical protein